MPQHGIAFAFGIVRGDALQQPTQGARCLEPVIARIEAVVSRAVSARVRSGRGCRSSSTFGMDAALGSCASSLMSAMTPCSASRRRRDGVVGTSGGIPGPSAVRGAGAGERCDARNTSYGLPEASPLSVLEGGSDAHSATASTSGMPWRAISRRAASSSRLPGRANGSGTGIGGMARSPSAIVRHHFRVGTCLDGFALGRFGFGGGIGPRFALPVAVVLVRGGLSVCGRLKLLHY